MNARGPRWVTQQRLNPRRRIIRHRDSTTYRDGTCHFLVLLHGESVLGLEFHKIHDLFISTGLLVGTGTLHPWTPGLLDL